MVLAAAGGVDHKQLCDLAQQHFGQLNDNIPGEIPQLTPAPFTGSEVIRARCVVT